MKKFLLGTIFGILISFGITTYAVDYIVNPNPFPILVNGESKEVEALNINNSTYLKLVDTGRALNVDVKFNGQEKQIEIGKTLSIDTNNWISADDLTNKYSVKITSGNQLILKKNNFKYVFLPRINSTLTDIQKLTDISKNTTISCQIFKDRVYFKIDELQTLGILN